MVRLDTNVVIAVVTGRIPIVRVRLSEQWRAGAEIQLPAIVLFEMRHGAARSERRAASEAALDEFLASGIPIAPFDAEDAAHAGDIRAYLEAKGTPIGPYDTLIAARPSSPPTRASSLACRGCWRLIGRRERGSKEECVGEPTQSSLDSIERKPWTARIYTTRGECVIPASATSSVGTSPIGLTFTRKFDASSRSLHGASTCCRL